MQNDIAIMRQVITERLKERPFICGPASDTPINVRGMSQSDKTILHACRGLVADGLVSETPSHFRAGGYYHSYYRLQGGA